MSTLAIFFIVSVTVIWLYTIYKDSKSNELLTLQMAYLVALMEAICIQKGIDVGSVQKDIDEEVED